MGKWSVGIEATRSSTNGERPTKPLPVHREDWPSSRRIASSCTRILAKVYLGATPETCSVLELESALQVPSGANHQARQEQDHVCRGYCIRLFATETEWSHMCQHPSSHTSRPADNALSKRSALGHALRFRRRSRTRDSRTSGVAECVVPRAVDVIVVVLSPEDKECCRRRLLHCRVLMRNTLPIVA